MEFLFTRKMLLGTIGINHIEISGQSDTLSAALQELNMYSRSVISRAQRGSMIGVMVGAVLGAVIGDWQTAALGLMMGGVLGCLSGTLAEK
jgi:hypothetical protein